MCSSLTILWYSLSLGLEWDFPVLWPLLSFPNLEPVHCSMSGSKCGFLTWIQISQEAVKVVWYSHLFENFPEFVVIHTIKSFSIVSEAEVDVFLEFSCFFNDPMDVSNLISGSSASKPTLEMLRPAKDYN